MLTLTAERTVNLIYPSHCFYNFIKLAVFTASLHAVDPSELINTSVATESVHFPLKDHLKKKTKKKLQACTQQEPQATLKIFYYFMLRKKINQWINRQVGNFPIVLLILI